MGAKSREPSIEKVKGTFEERTAGATAFEETERVREERKPQIVTPEEPQVEEVEKPKKTKKSKSSKKKRKTVK